GDAWGRAANRHLGTVGADRQVGRCEGGQLLSPRGGQGGRDLGRLGQDHLRAATRGGPAVGRRHHRTKTVGWLSDFAFGGFSLSLAFLPTHLNGYEASTRSSTISRCGASASDSRTLPSPEVYRGTRTSSCTPC